MITLFKNFKKVIQAGFEGIHLDQYGFPKWAIRRRHGQDELVDLAKDYPLLIQRIKEELVPLNSGVIIALGTILLIITGIIFISFQKETSSSNDSTVRAREMD
mgnify:CR=1 FL=1